MHGSGFLAAFAEGLTIAALDVELAMFLEYGGVTAEMLLLFTFVLFGNSIIWTGFTVHQWRNARSSPRGDFDPPAGLPTGTLAFQSGLGGRLLIAWLAKGSQLTAPNPLPVFAGLPEVSNCFQSAVGCARVRGTAGGSPLVLAQAPGDERSARLKALICCASMVRRKLKATREYRSLHRRRLPNSGRGDV